MGAGGERLSVAVFGDAKDRKRFRHAVNGQHVQVRSDGDGPVLGIANFDHAHPAIKKRYGATKYRRTIGYLPPPFREAMRVPWRAADQQWFDDYVDGLVARERRRPLWLSQSGFRLLLWDVRLRCRLRRRLV